MITMNKYYHYLVTYNFVSSKGKLIFGNVGFQSENRELDFRSIDALKEIICKENLKGEKVTNPVITSIFTLDSSHLEDPHYHYYVAYFVAGINGYYVEGLELECSTEIDSRHLLKLSIEAGEKEKVPPQQITIIFFKEIKCCCMEREKAKQRREENEISESKSKSSSESNVVNFRRKDDE